MFYNNRNSPEHSQASKNRKIQEIYKDELNNECFDCGNENPDFISANNGIFICKNVWEFIINLQMMLVL